MATVISGCAARIGTILAERPARLRGGPATGPWPKQEVTPSCLPVPYHLTMAEPHLPPGFRMLSRDYAGAWSACIGSAACRSAQAALAGTRSSARITCSCWASAAVEVTPWTASRPATPPIEFCRHRQYGDDAPVASRKLVLWTSAVPVQIDHHRLPAPRSTQKRTPTGYRCAASQPRLIWRPSRPVKGQPLAYKQNNKNKGTAFRRRRHHCAMATRLRRHSSYGGPD